MSFGIIIQARTGSKRLPNKIFLKIGKKTILEHIVDSLKKNQLLENTIVATTRKIQDKKIINFCKKKNIKFFLGNSQNVLKRFYLCNKKYKFDNIVRLTGDNPFIDIQCLKKLIKFHLKKNYDYSSTIKSLPIGMGSEIFTKKALEVSYYNARKSDQLEHANEFILQNPKKFKIKNLSFNYNINKNNSFTVDKLEDLEFLKKKFNKFKFNFEKYYKK